MHRDDNAGMLEKVATASRRTAQIKTQFGISKLIQCGEIEQFIHIEPGHAEIGLNPPSATPLNPLLGLVAQTFSHSYTAFSQLL